MTHALLFDMDGVLVDTEKVHEKSRQIIYKKYGMDYNMLKDIPVIGRNTDSIFIDVNSRIQFPIPLEKAIQEKRNVFVSLLNEPIKPLPGVREILESYHSRLKIGLVSASARQNIDAVMQNTGLALYFDCIISAEDVKSFKPDPQCYFLGASRLKIAPEECVVFEDSQIGVEAAINAGMKVIGVGTGHTADDLSNADIIISDMAKDRVKIDKFIGA